MGTALREKNLGRWAEVMQERTLYLPNSPHKGLREVHCLNFVHVWHVPVTPPHCLIYDVCHINLGVLYVGLTHMAPAQPFRKHMTDALADVDRASLHRLMLTVDMVGWGIAVLEDVDSLWWSGIREKGMVVPVQALGR